MAKYFLTIPLLVAIGCAYSYNSTLDTMFYEPVEVSANTVTAEVEKEESVEDKIINACQEYGVDSNLALAIAKLETGHFKSDAYIYGNNVGGISIDEVPVSYSSLDDGVVAFVENLAVNYIDCGLTNPYEMCEKYCPPNPTGWAESVSSLMYGGENDVK